MGLDFMEKFGIVFVGALVLGDKKVSWVDYLGSAKDFILRTPA